jgi:uncharacterized protein YegP (UPF0339 family)
MKPLRVETFKSGQQWYFRVRGRNGRIVAQSEGYKTRRSCERTAALIVTGPIVGPFAAVTVE